MGKFDIVQWTAKSSPSTRDRIPVHACFGLYPKIYTPSRLIYKAAIVGEDIEKPEVGVVKARRFRPGTERFWQGELDLNRYASELGHLFTDQTLAARIEFVDQYIAAVHRQTAWDKICLKMKPRYFRRLLKFEIVLIENGVTHFEYFYGDKVLEAFSHFSYCESNCQRLLYEFKGRRTIDGRYRLLTPEMLTHKYDIHKWFQKHTCNDICGRLKRPVECTEPDKPTNLPKDAMFNDFDNDLKPPSYQDEMSKKETNDSGNQYFNLETTFGAKSCDGSFNVVTALVHSEMNGKSKPDPEVLDRSENDILKKPDNESEHIKDEDCLGEKELSQQVNNDIIEQDILQKSVTEDLNLKNSVPSKSEIDFSHENESTLMAEDLTPCVHVESSTLLARSLPSYSCVVDREQAELFLLNDEDGFMNDNEVKQIQNEQDSNSDKNGNDSTNIPEDIWKDSDACIKYNSEHETLNMIPSDTIIDSNIHSNTHSIDYIQDNIEFDDDRNGTFIRRNDPTSTTVNKGSWEYFQDPAKTESIHLEQDQSQSLTKAIVNPIGDINIIVEDMNNLPETIDGQLEPTDAIFSTQLSLEEFEQKFVIQKMDTKGDNNDEIKSPETRNENNTEIAICSDNALTNETNPQESKEIKHTKSLACSKEVDADHTLYNSDTIAEALDQDSVILSEEDAKATKTEEVEKDNQPTGTTNDSEQEIQPFETKNMEQETHFIERQDLEQETHIKTEIHDSEQDILLTNTQDLDTETKQLEKEEIQSSKAHDFTLESHPTIDTKQTLSLDCNMNKDYGEASKPYLENKKVPTSQPSTELLILSESASERQCCFDEQLDQPTLEGVEIGIKPSVQDNTTDSVLCENTTMTDTKPLIEDGNINCSSKEDTPNICMSSMNNGISQIWDIDNKDFLVKYNLQEFVDNSENRSNGHECHQSNEQNNEHKNDSFCPNENKIDQTSSNKIIDVKSPSSPKPLTSSLKSGKRGSRKAKSVKFADSLEQEKSNCNVTKPTNENGLIETLPDPKIVVAIENGFKQSIEDLKAVVSIEKPGETNVILLESFKTDVNLKEPGWYNYIPCECCTSENITGRE